MGTGGLPMFANHPVTTSAGSCCWRRKTMTNPLVGVSACHLAPSHFSHFPLVTGLLPLVSGPSPRAVFGGS
eukprot:12920666-Prorocentrum_lima.AAC.1